MQHANIAERSFRERSAMLACYIWNSFAKNISKFNFQIFGFLRFHCIVNMPILIYLTYTIVDVISFMYFYAIALYFMPRCHADNSHSAITIYYCVSIGLYCSGL